MSSPGTEILSPEKDKDGLKPFEVDFEAPPNTEVGILAAKLGGLNPNYFLLDVVEDGDSLYKPGKL